MIFSLEDTKSTIEIHISAKFQVNSLYHSGYTMYKPIKNDEKSDFEFENIAQYLHIWYEKKAFSMS